MLQPICAVCNRPVSYLLEEYDMRLRVHRYTVRCHGEEETFEVGDELLRSAKRITVTRAFAKARSEGGLPAPPSTHPTPRTRHLGYHSAGGPVNRKEEP